MRVWALSLLLVGAVGCVEEASTELPSYFGQMPLEIYQVTWPGHDLRVTGEPYLVGLVISNPSSSAVSYGVGQENVTGQIAFVAEDGLHDQDVEGFTSVDRFQVVLDELAPGERRLWLVDRGDAETTIPPLVGVVFVFDGDTPVAARDVMAVASAAPHPTAVEPGMHVLAETVGFWVNGTAFYTNIPALLEDPEFPAGGHIDRDAAIASAAPLPIYVFDKDRSEQPARSADTCHFTTIDGYNALLKTQHEGTTGVRFLTPEEGYTRPGAEDHLLYGDALVFFNTIVAIEGSTTEADAAPDPQGACFDVDRYTPDPVPDLTRIQ